MLVQEGDDIPSLSVVAMVLPDRTLLESILRTTISTNHGLRVSANSHGSMVGHNYYFC